MTGEPEWKEAEELYTLPAAWIEAAAKGYEAASLGADRFGMEAALAAVMPLMTLDLLTHTSKDRLPYDKWTTEEVHAAIRAWAQERGIDMGETL